VLFVVYPVPFLNEGAAQTLQAILTVPKVRLAVVSQDPEERLSEELRRQLVGHWQVDDALDSGQITWAAGELANQHGPIDRLFTASEHLQLQVAEARERLGIPGMSVETTRSFRDKARMKEVLRAAGVPCARHLLATSPADAWEFVREVGYPVVAKPPAGAGTVTTFRAESDEALHQALAVLPPSPQQPVQLEEFISGDEHTFDTFSIDGWHVWHSISHYLPTPLEAMQTPWIQWCVMIPREIDDSRYDDIRVVAYQALDALGMRTGMSHLEWFRRRDGSVAVSEVGARPPGGQLTRMMSRANEFDCEGAWARLMITGEFEPPERSYAVGNAYLRAQGHGDRIIALHGLEEADREVGHLVTDVKLPHIGQAPSRHYTGDGYVIVRHPETAVVRDALHRIISCVRVQLG
jgi:hypothetical protein